MQPKPLRTNDSGNMPAGIAYTAVAPRRKHDNCLIHPEFLTVSNISAENTAGVPGGTRTPDLLLRRQLLYPVELRALEVEAREELVGAVGFELTTLCSQSRCATRLRYAPTREGAFYHQPETRTRSRAYLSTINIPCLGSAFLIFNRLFRH